MKIHLLLTAISLGIFSSLTAQIIHVPADQPTIQAGIDAANNGDTVLVDPGTYTENINFNGKNITVASLYLLTQDPAYISQTAIDGNQQGSVVSFASGEDSTALLCGFYLINGRGSYGGGGISCEFASPRLHHLIISSCSVAGYWGSGGGFYCREASPDLLDAKIMRCGATRGGGIYCYYSPGIRLTNLIIMNNNAEYGGGIYFEESNPELDGVTIIDNRAEFDGGGIYGYSGSFVHLKATNIIHNEANQGGGIFYSGNDLQFDSTDRCNIFSNTALYGNDLYSQGFMEVIVDTFTVAVPNKYYATPLSNFTFDILNSKIQQVDADLYVSPTGDNANSGLTPDDPLKNIRYAFSIIRPDSLNPHAVHLLEGIYSPSLTGEVFPVDLIDYIVLAGVNGNTVTLNAEEASGVVVVEQNRHSVISSLTVAHGTTQSNGGGIRCVDSKLLVQNVTINYNIASYWDYPVVGGGIYCSGSELTLDNTTISNNSSSHGGGIYYDNSTLLIKGSKIMNNKAESGWHWGEDAGGGGIFGSASVVSFENVLITGNEAPRGGGLYTINSGPILSGVIITENSAQIGGGIYCTGPSSPTFDPLNRSNLFLNIAFDASDLYSDCTMEVVVDTFSVITPTETFAKPLYNFSFDILHGKIEQVESDLYVSPSGSNNNSGLTPETPLRTIRFALLKMLADYSNRHTVHLMEGTFSPSSNNEFFPVILPNYVSLAGISGEKTVVDAEGEANVIRLVDNFSSVISGMTIRGGGNENYTYKGNGIYCENSSPVLSELTVSQNGEEGIFCIRSSPEMDRLNVMSNNRAGIHCEDNSSPEMHQVSISDNNGFGLYCTGLSNPVMEGGVITNNSSSGLYCEDHSDPSLRAVRISDNHGDNWTGGGVFCRDYSNPILDSVIVSNNRSQQSGGGISISNGSTIHIHNSAITGNESFSSGGGIMVWNATLYLNNSTISNNRASYEGGGIYGASRANLMIQHATISNNSTETGEGGGIKFGDKTGSSLLDVRIVSNKAERGGGMAFFNDSITILKDVTVTGNTAKENGGGLYKGYCDSYIIFDHHDRCNIYLNTAKTGKDLYSDYPMWIVVDTFSVLYPTAYFATAMDNFSFDILHGYIKQVEANLYVSPEGDNNNSGLTKTQPLKTIDFAVSKIRADSLHPRTVFLLEGWYGPYLTGEAFPIVLPDFINLKGSSEREVILDAEWKSEVLWLNNNTSSHIEGMTIRGGTYGSGRAAVYCFNSTSYLKDMTITENECDGIQCRDADIRLENMTIDRNSGTGIYCDYSNPVMKNMTISSNEYSGLDCWDSSPELEDVAISNNNGSGLVCFYSEPLLNNVTITNNRSSGVYCYESSPVMRDVIIADNITPYDGGGMYCDNFSNPILQYVVIENNTAEFGGGVYFRSSEPTIVHSSIIGNTASKQGGGICSMNSEPLLNYVDLSGNTAYDGGGAWFSMHNKRPSLLNVSFNQNRATNDGGAIYLKYCDPFLKNVAITGNEALNGGGIYCASLSNPMLVNVTFTDNQASTGGGMLCYNSSDPVLLNTVMWNDSPQEIYYREEGKPNSVSVSWSDIQGGKEGVITNGNGEVLWGEGNADIDPVFDVAGANPCMLCASSPCIDNGIPDTTGLLLPMYDIAGNPRIWNGRIDMGAFEWNNVNVDELQAASYKLQVFPNPAFGISKIIYQIAEIKNQLAFGSWQLAVKTNVRISLHEISGKQVRTLLNEAQLPGEHTLYFNTAGLPAGIYLMRMQAGDDVETQKLVLMK